METQEIEIVVTSELLKLAAERGDNRNWQSLANSVAHAVAYDRTLSGISDVTLRRAVRSAKVHFDFVSLMKSIREENALEETRKEEEAKAKITEYREKNADIVGWGYLLRCWDAYQSTGNLSRVRMLSVSFFADWLQSQDNLLLPDEKEWCNKIADKDADGLTGNEAKSARKCSYDEAVALVVLKKIQRSMGTTNGRLKALLDTKRAQYTEYYKTNYGREPDWTLLDINRAPATTAYARKQR